MEKGDPKNIEGLLFEEQQAGYLAGYLAGLYAKEHSYKTISSVGGQKSRRSTITSPGTRPAPRRPTRGSRR